MTQPDSVTESTKRCDLCGFAPKNVRKLFEDAWDGKRKCDDYAACKKRAAKRKELAK